MLCFCYDASLGRKWLTRVLQHYRYWVVWRCPSIRFLDYQKVKEVEREKGRELFGTDEEPTALAAKVG